MHVPFSYSWGCCATVLHLVVESYILLLVYAESYTKIKFPLEIVMRMNSNAKTIRNIRNGNGNARHLKLEIINVYVCVVHTQHNIMYLVCTRGLHNTLRDNGTNELNWNQIK